MPKQYKANKKNSSFKGRRTVGSKKSNYVASETSESTVTSVSSNTQSENNTTDIMKGILNTDSEPLRTVNNMQSNMSAMSPMMQQLQQPMMQPMMQPSMQPSMQPMQQPPMMGNGQIDPLMVETLVPMNQSNMNNHMGQNLLSGAQMAHNLGNLAKLSNTYQPTNNMAVMSEMSPMMQQMPMQQMPMQQMPMQQMPTQQMQQMPMQQMGGYDLRNLTKL